MTDEVGAALAAGDPAALARALADSSVAVPVTERDGGVVPVVLVDKEGVRCVAAFTSREALGMWGGGTVEMVPGPDVALLAASQHADQVIFDPAGPVPVRFAPAALAAISDGVVTRADGETVVVGDLHVLPARGEDALALRSRLEGWVSSAGTGAEIWIVDRVAGDHLVLTVGVHGSEDEVAAVHEAVAERAAGIAVVDVLVLDGPTRDALAADLPDSRLDAAG